MMSAAAIAIAIHRSALPGLRPAGGARGIVERRSFYPRWGRRSSCNFVFVGFLLFGFVRGTRLRLRRISKPTLRAPFPTREPKAGDFRDSRRSTAAMSISFSEVSFKILSPDPVDAAARAAATFRAADFRSERASLS
jgi:hypothetical protein